MRISESKCFLWHRLCLLPQGTTRQMGLSLLLQRGHVEGGGTPWGRASQPWATAPTSTTATRAARSFPPRLQKHGDSSRLGTGEEFPPSRESRTQECLLVRVAKGKEKCFAIEFSYISSLLERAWLEGQAVLFRPVFLQSWLLITASAMQIPCCYGCICLFHSHVPALNPAFAFGSAVTAHTWQ